ncbi:MAG: 3-phosphoshikimate 1-carboxyvinyltransferase [Ruminococcaceae bacterium]|nr:3-phosphoshikimate 1-carboxyvinyltransferase [Oscillospiraceae bacterium]
MDITIYPRQLRGETDVIPSKSQAHRLLICAAFADNPTQLVCRETNQDIEATVGCLRALGAQITETDSGYTVIPTQEIPTCAELHCRESGSTLRFLLPIVGALGVDGTFIMEGRLADRPLSPLWEEMERMGCTLSRPSENTLRCTGKLKSGAYQINGNVTSQFITGLLFAHSLMGDCTLTVTGKLESKPYVELTNAALALFANRHSPGCVSVEGDWSNGAFWLVANRLGSELTVRGLSRDSLQGDRAVVEILQLLQSSKPTISVADIPDLVPVLSVAAAANHGAVFTDIQRLRLKESDRVASVIHMLQSLGGKAYATEDTLTILPSSLTGGTVDGCNDHRIVMAAAIAATICTEPVRILGAEAVQKSYPAFWAEYRRLGGNYE